MKKIFTIVLFLFAVINLSHAGEWKIVEKWDTYYHGGGDFGISTEGDSLAVFTYTQRAVESGKQNSYQIIMGTRNGGQSWDTITKVNTRNYGKDFGFPNGYFTFLISIHISNNTIFLMSNYDGIIRSTNFGESWDFTYIRPDTVQDHKFIDGHTLDENHGALLYLYKLKVTYDTIYGFHYTNDGWKTFEFINKPEKYKSWDFRKIRMNSPGGVTILAYDSTDKVRYEDPDGYRFVVYDIETGQWSDYPSGSKTKIRDVDFVNDTVGYYCGYEDETDQYAGMHHISTIYKTTDAGKSWFSVLREQDSIINVGLFDIDFADENLGAVVGGSSVKIEFYNMQSNYITTDGGKNWKQFATEGSYVSNTGGAVSIGSVENAYIYVDRNFMKFYPEGVGVEEEESYEINAYPNPAPAGKAISFNLPKSNTGSIKIEVYNLAGGLVEKAELQGISNSSNEVQFAPDKEWLPGVYIFRFSYGINKSYDVKVVIEK